ncbi:hypothetical protein ACJMK2_032745 [Sinanodonta woodiana]|uniref:CID domain-containing protein n=1 Tax=Sinanodonta woodiana TaxID=1069815 RepID=A0ABD3X4K3_SINWO
MSKPEDVIAVYQLALRDLREVMVAHIQFLTMMADEHIQYAAEIVHTIEAHIEKVKPREKLAAIYLIDSIVKDLPQSSYKSLFTKNIVRTFTSVFEKVNDKRRLALFAVRLSWVGVFPNNALYRLDWQIKSRLDPGWPIKATPPVLGSNHVDPSCLQSRQQIHVIHNVVQIAKIMTVHCVQIAKIMTVHCVHIAKMMTTMAVHCPDCYDNDIISYIVFSWNMFDSFNLQLVKRKIMKKRFFKHFYLCLLKWCRSEEENTKPSHGRRNKLAIIYLQNDLWK